MLSRVFFVLFCFVFKNFVFFRQLLELKDRINSPNWPKVPKPCMTRSSFRLSSTFLLLVPGNRNSILNWISLKLFGQSSLVLMYYNGGPEELWALYFIHCRWTLQYMSEEILFSRFQNQSSLWKKIEALKTILRLHL